MDLEDKKVEIAGADIVKELKSRHSNLALYNGFLLITMTKNLKMLYYNLDSFVGVYKKELDKEKLPMAIYEKIYGQQSFIMCSEIIVVDSKSASFLACLKEFKLNFV